MNKEQLIQENKELRRWKEHANRVLDAIDLQQCGEILGVELGKDISSQILPALKELVKLRYNQS